VSAKQINKLEAHLFNSTEMHLHLRRKPKGGYKKSFHGSLGSLQETVLEWEGFGFVIFYLSFWLKKYF
jgi:hypothetical protein